MVIACLSSLLEHIDVKDNRFETKHIKLYPTIVITNTQYSTLREQIINLCKILPPLSPAMQHEIKQL
jgi:hypothetical protein